MIEFAEILPLYFIALAVTLPAIALRVWRRDRILTLGLLRNGK